MITADLLAEIGKLGKPHGINGEINAYVDENVNPECIERIFLEIDGIFVPFFIEDLRQKRRDTLILSLDGIKNETQASELTHHIIFVMKDDDVFYHDEDEVNEGEGMYASDLIGYSIVENAQNDDEPYTIGMVKDIDGSTPNTLFVVEREDSSILYIPVADEYIMDIDTENRIINMSLPAGLLSL